MISFDAPVSRKLLNFFLTHTPFLITLCGPWDHLHRSLIHALVLLFGCCSLFRLCIAKLGVFKHMVWGIAMRYLDCPGGFIPPTTRLRTLCLIMGPTWTRKAFLELLRWWARSCMVLGKFGLDVPTFIFMIMSFLALQISPSLMWLNRTVTCQAPTSLRRLCSPFQGTSVASHCSRPAAAIHQRVLEHPCGRKFGTPVQRSHRNATCPIGERTIGQNKRVRSIQDNMPSHQKNTGTRRQEFLVIWSK